MKEMCKNFISDADDAKTMYQKKQNCSGNSCDACVIEQVGLAQAYVPSQPYQKPMGQEQSLVCGTTFASLVMPYCAGWHLYHSAKEAKE